MFFHLLDAKVGLELPDRLRIHQNFQPFSPAPHLEKEEMEEYIDSESELPTILPSSTSGKEEMEEQTVNLYHKDQFLCSKAE